MVEMMCWSAAGAGTGCKAASPHRVLRPPGGGSNFSLGFDEPKEQPVRRNKMASSIFGTPEENPPSWAKAGEPVVLCFHICFWGLIHFVAQPDAAGGWCGNQSSLPAWYFGIMNDVCLQRIVYFSLISSRRVYFMQVLGMLQAENFILNAVCPSSVTQVDLCLTVWSSTAWS